MPTYIKTIIIAADYDPTKYDEPLTPAGFKARAEEDLDQACAAFADLMEEAYGPVHSGVFILEEGDVTLVKED